MEPFPEQGVGGGQEHVFRGKYTIKYSLLESRLDLKSPVLFCHDVLYFSSSLTFSVTCKHLKNMDS